MKSCSVLLVVAHSILLENEINIPSSTSMVNAGYDEVHTIFFSKSSKTKTHHLLKTLQSKKGMETDFLFWEDIEDKESESIVNNLSEMINVDNINFYKASKEMNLIKIEVPLTALEFS